MIVILWVNKFFIGIVKFVCKIIFIIFIDWCIGFVIWYVVIIVILYVFECFYVMLYVWEFVVVDEFIV